MSLPLLSRVMRPSLDFAAFHSSLKWCTRATVKEGGMQGSSRFMRNQYVGVRCTERS